MQLTKIELEHFRNYEKVQVSVNSDLVLILGDNAAGKTNFLESIYYASTLKSFRGPEATLVGYEQDHFRIKTAAGPERWEVAVQVNPVARKVLKINDVKTTRTLWKSYTTVLFVPPDLNLFTFGPTLRRKFLDDTLSQLRKDYAADLASLEHILKQRAALLIKIQKQAGGREELKIWDRQLAELAVQIGTIRKEFIDYINRRFDSVYEALTGFKNEFEILYKKSASTIEEFFEHLSELEEAEVRTGQNLIGPHREDWTIHKDSLLNVYNSSRGELRAQILALKLIQADYLKEAGLAPVMLLDDVFSELDETRRMKLLAWASPYQMFITSTEEHHLPKINRLTQTLRVKNGLIT